MKSQRFTPGFTFSRHGDYAEALASMEAHRRAIKSLTQLVWALVVFALVFIGACFV